MSETKNTTPFSQQLAYINKGTLDAELTEALAEVIKAVRETGKKGAVTLTLNCAMLNTRDENTMKVTPKVSRTIPELDRADKRGWPGLIPSGPNPPMAIYCVTILRRHSLI